MELESLRYIWHSLEVPPGIGQDREALLDLLEKKSQAPISRMRRNLIGESVLLLVAYVPAILVFLLGFNGRLVALSWLFIFLLVLFFAYYYCKYRLLSKMQCPTCQLRTNLARQVRTLKQYTRIYLLGGTGMIPLAYVVAYFMIRLKVPSGAGTFPLLWLVLLVPVTIGMYYINASYVNRLYGRHIRKLQELLQELDAE